MTMIIPAIPSTGKHNEMSDKKREQNQGHRNNIDLERQPGHGQDKQDAIH